MRVGDLLRGFRLESSRSKQLQEFVSLRLHQEYLSPQFKEIALAIMFHNRC